MAFVVDGSQWSFSGWTANQIALALDVFLDRVEIVGRRLEKIWIGSDLQSRDVYDGMDLWSLVCSPDFAGHAEVVQELAAWLGRAAYYEDEDEWPEGFEDALDISIDNGKTQTNPDVAWAHHWVRSNRAVGCLAITDSGVRATKTRLGSASVHWLKSENEQRAFWRSAIDVEGDSEMTLERLAKHAFPDLYFYQDVWQGIRRFNGGYASAGAELCRYLGILNDYGEWAFTCPPPTLHPDEMPSARDGAPSNQIIEKRFSGLGITMAPENPDVYKDGNCRRAREVALGGRVLYCEWHGKLEAHQNRIHIHAPVKESSGKVVIAIFRDHLPLP